MKNILLNSSDGYSSDLVSQLFSYCINAVQPYFIDQGINGYLFEYRNTKENIVKLYEDKILKENIGFEARKKSRRQFSLSHYFKNHLQIISTF